MPELIKRNMYCGKPRLRDEGRAVRLNGWVQRSRRLGGLIFCDLRDKTGIVQIVFDEELPPEIFEAAETLRNEYVIGVEGVCRERESKNPGLATGDVEIRAERLVIYSAAETPPIYVKDDDNVSEELRMRYRYLDLRKLRMQRNLAFRHEVCRATRVYFSDNGFVEIETPMLIRPTPEGARDYLVPSRINNGNFYALPQSPQMYKQLLMASGADRYFQIARCFRDEDLRADRQPEFTQVDLEMSFVDMEDVIGIQEGYMKFLMKETLEIDIETPFPRYTYEEAMSHYGSDKPDTRLGLEIADISSYVEGKGFSVFADAISAGGSVRGICVPGGVSAFSRKDIDRLADSVKGYGAKGLAWIKLMEGGVSSPIGKFFTEKEMDALVTAFGAETGDLILIIADADKIVYATLSYLRSVAAEKLGLIDESRFDFLWVTDFPLFESDGEGGYKAMHHPFTMPDPRDMDKIESDPAAVRSLAYDLVLNGTEIGGGSIRIHDRDLQNRMFSALGLSDEEIKGQFGFLLDAFRYGVPPHGGLAYGLDRLIMLLLGEDSIRETMAFPKNQDAEDPVSGAPASAPLEQLAELGLELVKG
ncbi:MAG: aspartate--tRNA ligase [Clostridiales Family XIII bacterium]|jgi:aspartyl-tRNA synthetase|nr:aspartate--tRNA ligase [Clostridiales Family XIII bacterium]